MRGLARRGFTRWGSRLRRRGRGATVVCVAVRDDRPGASAPAGLDIKALLSVALEQKPKNDVEERVMTRVATVTTAMEFARLLLVAPFDWLVEDNLRGLDDDDDDDDADANHDSENRDNENNDAEADRADDLRSPENHEECDDNAAG